MLYFRFLINYSEEGLGSAPGTCRCILPAGKANATERNRTKGAGAVGGTNSKPGRGGKQLPIDPSCHKCGDRFLLLK